MSLKSSSKFKAHEKEQLVMHCYEIAGDLALNYIQEREKGVSQQPLGTQMITLEEEGIGHILENAIQQSPIIYIKNG